MKSSFDFGVLESMYSFLLNEFNMALVGTNFHEKSPTLYYADLATENFLLRYRVDHHGFDVEVKPKNDDNWIPLTFIMDFLQNPDEVNSVERKDSFAKIKVLNQFLRENFFRLNEWYSKENYPINKQLLTKAADKALRRNFPGAVKKRRDQ